MTDLIRNCAHYSTHQTLIDQNTDTNPARTIKTTFASDGVAGLQAEYDGLTWYASRLNQDIATMVLQFRSTAGYARLETRYVDGTVIPMPADPGSLIEKTAAAVSFYVTHLWSGADTPSHGDYSLSNHVFDSAGNVATIIDWEHFNRLLPPQYDPLYMIVEPFLFWHANNKTPNTESVSAAKTQIAILRSDIALPDDATRAPASWLRQIASQNNDAWGEQSHKVPFLNSHENQISKIDHVLGNA